MYILKSCAADSVECKQANISASNKSEGVESLLQKVEVRLLIFIIDSRFREEMYI